MQHMKFFAFLMLFISSSLHANTSSYKLESISHNQSSAESSNSNEADSAVLEKEEISYANVSSVDDLFRLNNSVSTSRGPRSFGETPQVRGLDAGKIFVYVDGERQNFKAGHTSMLAFDLENIKALKVYENSSDYSKTGTLSGGVVFKTIDPEDVLLKGATKTTELKSQYNSANSEKILNIKSAYKLKKSKGLISYSNKEANDLSLNDDSVLENSSYLENNLLFKQYFGQFSFKYEYFNREDKSPLDPSLNPPEFLESLLGESQFTKNTLALKWSDKNYIANVYRNLVEMEKVNKKTSISESRDLETLGAAFQMKTSTWSYGVDAVQDRLSSERSGATINSYPKAQKTEGSVYVDRKVRYARLTVTPGIKATAYTMRTNEGNLRVKSNNDISKKLLTRIDLDKFSFQVNYIESVNSPKVQEVYPSGLHTPGDDFIVRDNFFIPNPDLTHEKSELKEAKVSYKSNLLSDYDLVTASYTYYDNSIQDYIYNERIDRSILDDENGTTQFVNIPTAKIIGESIDLKYNYDQVEVKLGYAKIRGKNQDRNLYLEDLPADTYTIDLKYFLDQHRVVFGYQGTKALKQNRVNPNSLQRTESTDEYYVQSIFINKGFNKNWNANFRVDNLGNVKYRRHGSHLFESKEDMKILISYKI